MNSCRCTGIVFLGLITLLFLCTYVLLETNFGKNQIVSYLVEKTHCETPFKSLSLGSLTGNLPHDFLINDIVVVPGLFNLSQIHASYNYHYNPIYSWGLKPGDIILNTTLSEIHFSQFQESQCQFEIIYAGTNGALKYNFWCPFSERPSFEMHTLHGHFINATFHYQNNTLIVDWLNEFFQWGVHQKIHFKKGPNRLYSFTGQLALFPNSTLFSPIHQVVWDSDSLEIDVGLYPIQFNFAKKVIIHGPMKAKIEMNEILLSLTGGQLGSYDCVTMDAIITNKKRAQLTQVIAKTSSSVLTGSGYFYFETRKLNLNVDIDF